MDVSMDIKQMTEGLNPRTPGTDRLDFKLEVVAIPVTDIERSIAFYKGIGWRLDADFKVGDAFRGIQFTPPGSSCSIHFGKGVTQATAGSANGLFLVVSDIEAARADLLRRGVAVGEVFHLTPGTPPVPGRDPAGRSYTSHAAFTDPDGNTWLLQEVTSRFPGRVEASGCAYTSSADLATALRRAAAAHGEHEKRNPGHRHDDWPEWYAEYMAAEQTGSPLPT
jgi:catechol 2,3-dioxygenase-like lactoylglutathione lyase family enzyme